MDAFFEFLSENLKAANVILIAFIVILSVLTTIFIIAFFQGRKISILRLEIGEKPQIEKQRHPDGVHATNNPLKIGANNRNSEKEGSKVVSSSSVDDSQVFPIISERYGIGYLSMDIDCVINVDGSATVERRIELIAQSDILFLDTFLLIPTEKDGSWDIKRINVFSTRPEREITIDSENPEPNVKSTRLVFSPPLRPGEQAGYKLQERLPDSFYTFANSQVELKEIRNPDAFFGLNDYFGWHINRPTQKFRLRVYFPEGWKTRFVESKVIYATASAFPIPSEQRDENRRLKFDHIRPEIGRHFIELSVDYPMIGLIYVASWEPVFSEV